MLYKAVEYLLSLFFLGKKVIISYYKPPYRLFLKTICEPPSIYRTPCLMGIIQVTRSYDEQQQLHKRI